MSKFKHKRLNITAEVIDFLAHGQCDKTIGMTFVIFRETKN